ncbi:MAG: metal ABC transporter ATP-binding protein, partial [Verrucomicrobia bacterium]|nr:metal ABC transporter ATP-binding protein [Verrucomicrobiota bacterium]
EESGIRLLGLDRFEVGQGEHTVVMGPNGAGKSTFLKVCLGLRRAGSGCVEVLGEEVTSLSRRRLLELRKRVGYVPQRMSEPSELPLTVHEVVSIGRTARAGLCRRLTKADAGIVDECLEKLGISELSGRQYGKLSGGQQKKVLIARAMVQEPELLFLDEPSANLDLGWRERLVRTIDELARYAGITIVLVCHELENVPSCVGKALLLNKGVKIAEGDPASVFTTERIREVYGEGFGVMRVGESRFFSYPECGG